MASVSTVDKSEIEKFSKISWDRNGPLKPLFAMNHIRIPLVESTLDLKSSEKKLILDIGCGGGFLSEELAQRLESLGVDFEVVGLDPSVENVELAKGHLPQELRGRVTYLPLSIEEYVEKYPHKKFDTVVMSEVIEHVDNPTEFVEMAVQTAKSGGSIIITTPSKTILSCISMILCAEYILRMLPIGTHEYKKFVSHQESTRLLQSNNCDVKEVRGLFYNPVSNRWRFVFFKQLVYVVHAVKN